MRVVNLLHDARRPRGRDDDANIYNDVKLWDTWDHYPIYRKYHRKKEEEVDRMEAEDRRAKKRTQEKVMENGEDKIDESLALGGKSQEK